MISQNSSKFVMLVVLDGWGMAVPGPGNAITQAYTPNMSRFWSLYPHTQLGASGEAVGLPRGEVGNTETGHLNLGAGKIIYQDLARINMAIADGSFSQNQQLIGAFTHAKENNSNLHIMGLVGAGGVHSNLEHLIALIELAGRQKFTRVFLHLFTDGRDSPPTSAALYVSKLKEEINKQGVGQIASIMGRYWAMDRDMRWERTQRAYVALTQGVGHLVKTPEDAIEASYKLGRTDEFIEPSLIVNEKGIPITKISENDAVIFFNFRIDRPRQLTKAFVLSDFEKGAVDLSYDPHVVSYAKTHNPTPAPVSVFNRGEKIKNLYFVTMTEYSKTISQAGAVVAFPPENVTLPLGRVISDHNLKQLRASESEKERFVTYYFNGQQEVAFPGEDRLIIPSPKIPTYDLEPAMSAKELTDALLHRLWINNTYSFVLVNYANADMVGHTGNIGSTVTACQVVDECLGKLASYIMAYNGTMVITADHGNAEEMIRAQTGDVDTEHSSNPVPFIVVSKAITGQSTMHKTGILADVAPTILSLMGLPIPTTMIGRNLLSP